MITAAEVPKPVTTIHGHGPLPLPGNEVRELGRGEKKGLKWWWGGGYAKPHDMGHVNECPWHCRWKVNSTLVAIKTLTLPPIHEIFMNFVWPWSL